MSEEPCNLVLSLQKAVMDFSGTIGELCSDVAHIKKSVDNGLSAKLALTSEKLDEFITADSIRAAKLDSQNWFTRLLEGSVRKVIGLVLVVILLNGLASAGIWAGLKAFQFKETPGQQQRIVTALGDKYHTHTMKDGRVLLHAGDSDQPAWLFNPKTHSWDRAPMLRTD